MSRVRGGLIWGLVLAVLGVLLLLWNFDVFASLAAQVPLILTGVMLFLGLAFLFGFVARRQEWWRAIPGFLLLSVAAIIYLAGRPVPEVWSGAVLFLGLALAFGVIFFSNRRQNWWAMIPAGTLTVVAALLLLSTQGLPAAVLGAVLYGGMGLVFGLLYLLAPERRQFLWALMPAGVLLLMGLITLFAGLGQDNPSLAPWLRLWPLLLVIAGIGLAVLALGRSGQGGAPAQELPPVPQAAESTAAQGAGVHAVPETGQGVVPAADAAGGEVPDLYEFLRNAPPEQYKE